MQKPRSTLTKNQRAARRDSRKQRKRRNMELQELLSDIQTRAAVLGIGTASAYLKSMQGCLDGSGLCPAAIFKGAAAEQWLKEVTDSASRLTYCGGDMADPELLTKSINEGTGISKGAVLEYDAILSCRQKDRDGDVIEQKGGLEIDLKMPLLWQHIQLQPIGKHVALLEQDEYITKCRFAIADTEMGRDAATLVKFGALRKSHGFKPSEFTPLSVVKAADGRDVVKGWHIKKANCMEGSLVSIPANPGTAVLAYYEKEFDGVCTAFGCDALKTDVVKQWAKSVYDARPVQVPGVTLETKEAAPPETKGGGHNCAKCGGAMSCPHCAGKKSTDCGCTKAAAEVVAPPAAPEIITKMAEVPFQKMYGANNPYPVGSFEAVQYELNRTARTYLESKGTPFSTDGYTYIAATFADSAIICLHPYSSKGKTVCYRVAWSAADGVPAWTGEPAEVEIQAVVIDKAFDGLLTKQLREHVVTSASPADLARQLIAKSITDPEAAKACGEVAKIAAVHEFQQQPSAGLASLLNL